MKCRQIMKTNVKFCAPTDGVFAAAQMMRDEEVGFIPVCDKDLRVVGVITDRDIAVRVVAERLSGDTPVRRIMTKNPIACHPDDPLDEVMAMMERHKISRMLCLDGNDALAGVLSLSDIAQEESDERVARVVRGVTDREVTVH
jgi:CBS domain-containing protein